MGTKTTYSCDRCPFESENEDDITDVDLSIGGSLEWNAVDLCPECIETLKELFNERFLAKESVQSNYLPEILAKSHVAFYTTKEE